MGREHFDSPHPKQVVQQVETPALLRPTWLQAMAVFRLIPAQPMCRSLAEMIFCQTRCAFASRAGLEMAQVAIDVERIHTAMFKTLHHASLAHLAVTQRVLGQSLRLSADAPSGRPSKTGLRVVAANPLRCYLMVFA